MEYAPGWHTRRSADSGWPAYISHVPPTRTGPLEVAEALDIPGGDQVTCQPSGGLSQLPVCLERIAELVLLVASQPASAKAGHPRHAVHKGFSVDNGLLASGSGSRSSMRRCGFPSPSTPGLPLLPPRSRSAPPLPPPPQASRAWRFSALIGMPVVDFRYARLHMVQNLCDDRPRNTHTGHMACGRAAQIMRHKNDARHRHYMQDGLLYIPESAGWARRGLGNTHGLAAVACNARRRSSAGALRGTRWASPFLAISAGMVHHPVSRSISAQRIARTSPPRWAVSSGVCNKPSVRGRAGQNLPIPPEFPLQSRHDPVRPL